MKFKSLKNQAGFTVIEALIVIGLALAALSLVLTNSTKASNKSTTKDAVTTTANMVTTIRSNMASSGSYNLLSATIVNGLAVVSEPLTFDGTNIRDNYGNIMNFVGNAAAAGTAPSFVVTYGGATNPISKEDCTSFAKGLVSQADIVQIGAQASMTTTNGLAGGGSVYKSGAGATPSIASLTTGCATTNPQIVMQFH
jgi:type II secretory pathway pseudopilin PulG